MRIRVLILTLLLFLLPISAMADITTGLVAYWTFNTDGADASGNLHTGTLSGTPTFLSGANCKVGGCLSCDGVDDRVAYTAITTSTTFTLTAWVYIGTPSGVYGPVLTDALGDNGIFILDTKIDFYYSAADHLSTTAFANNTWTHIGVVVNAGAVQFYLNGATDGTASSATSFSAATTCQNSTLNLPMTGRLDEVRLFSRTLSQAEVQEAMNFTGGAAPVIGKRRPIIY